MRTVFFVPALDKVSGGLYVIFELASALQRKGFELALSGPDAEEKAAALGLPSIPWADVMQGKALGKDDLLCIPESWPNAMIPGLKAGARVLVYVQNWSVLSEALPSGVAWRQLPLEYFAVSQPVAWFMQNFLGLEAKSILSPAIPECFFKASSQKPVNKVLRLAWMPRKNKAMARQIIELARLRLELLSQAPTLELIEIDKKSREETAQLLGTAHVFLNTAFPEGFGLPSLEAMAAGAVPVGFSGAGGFDYMRNPEECTELALYKPIFPLSPLSCRCNGLFVSDGDVMGAAMALAQACIMAASPDRYPLWQMMKAGAAMTAANYTLGILEDKAASFWNKLQINA